MKKSALFVMFMILLWGSLAANGQIFTMKAGYNLADMKVGGSDGVDQNKVKSGFHAGVSVEFPIKNNFSIEPRLLLSSKGSKGPYFDMEAYGVSKTTLNYLDIPVNFKFNKQVGNRVNIFAVAGPYLGIGLSGVYEWEATGMIGGKINDDRPIKWGKGKDFNRFDYGISAGGGVEVRKLQFSVSYDYGLGKIRDFGSVYVNNRVLKFSVGYRFGKMRS